MRGLSRADRKSHVTHQYSPYHTPLALTCMHPLCLSQAIHTCLGVEKKQRKLHEVTATAICSVRAYQHPARHHSFDNSPKLLDDLVVEAV
jgi:hypothetical protein